MKKIGILTWICSCAWLLCACANHATGADAGDAVQNECGTTGSVMAGSELTEEEMNAAGNDPVHRDSYL